MLKFASIVSAVALTASVSSAAILAEWTFEVSVPTNAGPHVAEGGVFAASSNAIGATLGAYSNPAGNASAESFSSNAWNTGDYYEFSTSSVGYQDLVFSIDHISSGTGPRDFRIAWSTDGIIFTGVADYVVLANTAPNTWSAAGPAVLASKYSFDLSAISALDNQPVIYIRTTQTTSTAANTTGTVASAGTSRVDNVIVRGVVIPEPATLGLLAGAGILALRRRA